MIRSPESRLKSGTPDTMHDRRRLLRLAATGALLYRVGGLPALLTPAAARAAGAELEVLSPMEVTTLEALGETFLPGAAAEGLVHYIDRQLAVPVEDCLLLVRYLDVPPPWRDFYHEGLAALERVARSRFGSGFAALDDAERGRLVDGLATDAVSGWQGPPAPLFHYLLRADAVDVVYGTQRGFEKLDIPYMAHITPPSPWS